MVAEWNQALPRLRERVGERNFTAWIEPIRCVRVPEGLRLEVGSRFILDWVSGNFLDAIRGTLREEGCELPLVLVVGDGRHGSVTKPRVAAEALVDTSPVARLPRKPQIGHLVPEYTFESFVVGESNARTFRAVQAIAEQPGRRFNPLFVWGGVGLGKTHLVHALANDLLRRPARRRVGCIAAETFMNAMIGSLKQDHMAAFRDRFRALDVLILDDVQFLAGKERTQEEFFHTFNALYEANKQVVLTSDKPPHEIHQLEQRLRSRFEGGLIADIRPPTAEMRLAIVRKKAALHALELSDETALVIVARSGSSVRELEGALNRVMAISDLEGQPMTPVLAAEVLGSTAVAAGIVTVEDIQAMVCQHFGVSVSDLTSHSRERRLVMPRQIAMYLSRTIADASYPAIAEKFGGRDHTTVMHAVRAIEEKRQQDQAADELVKTLDQTARKGPRSRKPAAPSSSAKAS